MLFVLTTPRGQVYRFSVLSCAQLFQSAYGGTIVSEWDQHVEAVVE
jgi:hypothetical protein